MEDPARVVAQLAHDTQRLTDVLGGTLETIQRLQRQMNDLQAFVLDLERRLGEARVIKVGTDPHNSFPPDRYELHLPPMRMPDDTDDDAPA